MDMQWWHWAVLGLVLGLFELATPGGFFILFFGVGALLVSLLSIGGIAGPLWVQWVLFGGVSIRESPASSGIRCCAACARREHTGLIRLADRRHRGRQGRHRAGRDRQRRAARHRLERAERRRGRAAPGPALRRSQGRTG